MIGARLAMNAPHSMPFYPLGTKGCFLLPAKRWGGEDVDVCIAGCLDWFLDGSAFNLKKNKYELLAKKEAAILCKVDAKIDA